MAVSSLMSLLHSLQEAAMHGVYPKGAGSFLGSIQPLKYQNAIFRGKPGESNTFRNLLFKPNALASTTLLIISASTDVAKVRYEHQSCGRVSPPDLWQAYCWPCIVISINKKRRSMDCTCTEASYMY